MTGYCLIKTEISEEMFEKEHKVKEKGSKITNLPGTSLVGRYSSNCCVYTLVIVSRRMLNIDR